jgi:hypothetical protein
LKDEFLDLVCISSLSRREGAIARRLEVILKGMGATVETDDAGERVGGETGNLLARFPGSVPGAPPFLLSCHMDTVGPAAAIRPVVDGDLVRTDGTSVLGGDDKAGIVAIFEAIRVLRGRGIPHGDIEVVLTICEESGLAGAKHFDTGRLRARRGLVLDVDGVSELITRAPGANRLAFTVHGLAAHAGICPEQGPLGDPDGGGGDIGDAPRPPRRGDHRESRSDRGRPRHEYRARSRRRPRRDAQPQPGEARGANGSHAPLLPGRRRAAIGARGRARAPGAGGSRRPPSVRSPRCA